MSKGNNSQDNIVKDDPAYSVPEVDEFAVSAFKAMGVEVNDSFASVYNDFKRLKDRLQPGRMKPADFVTCVLLCKKG